MSGTVPMITAGSITGISGKDERPVYFVKLNNSMTNTLVIKGEKRGHTGGEIQQITGSVHWSSKLMKNVNNRLVNSKVMTDAEVAIFQQVVFSQFAPGTAQYERVNPATSFSWVKMPYVAGLTDTDYVEIDEHEQLSKIKANIKMFLDPGIWQELGEIVAVDIFNGNNDRFNIKSGTWDNVGNIMFQNGTAAIGLDTFDPYSFTGADQSKGGNSNLMVGGAFHELGMLNDQARLRAFGTRCLMSVGQRLQAPLLQGGVARVGFNLSDSNTYVYIDTDKLNNYFLTNYIDNFVSGLVSGSAKLKNYLQQKSRQYGAPTRTAPAIPGQRPATPPPPARPAQPPVAQLAPGVRPQTGPAKSLPRGIQERMNYLGW